MSPPRLRRLLREYVKDTYLNYGQKHGLLSGSSCKPLFKPHLAKCLLVIIYFFFTNSPYNLEDHTLRCSNSYRCQDMCGSLAIPTRALLLLRKLLRVKPPKAYCRRRTFREFSRVDGLPIVLNHGASLARFTRSSSAIIRKLGASVR